MIKALKYLVFFIWVVIPQGMGGAPWHRYHKIFKLEE